jgi:hypothetical protein
MKTLERDFVSALIQFDASAVDYASLGNFYQCSLAHRVAGVDPSVVGRRFQPLSEVLLNQQLMVIGLAQPFSSGNEVRIEVIAHVAIGDGHLIDVEMLRMPETKPFAHNVPILIKRRHFRPGTALNPKSAVFKCYLIDWPGAEIQLPRIKLPAARGSAGDLDRRKRGCIDGHSLVKLGLEGCREET